MRRILFIALFAGFQLSLAQTPEEDEVIFQSAVDWLNSKLNYIYYDEVNGNWWNNTFYINEQKIVTIKNISSSVPNTANIRDKTYNIRKFKIQDINPNSLEIKAVEKSQGRIVKGKMLELRTYGFQDLIHKTINNRRGSSTSFLFLSFPESLTDSISNYAEVVKEKFSQAIAASIRIYPTGGEVDLATILSVLTGKHISENGAEWEANEVQKDILKVESNSDVIQYFGLDQKKNQFYLLEISNQGVVTKYLELIREDGLSLKYENEVIFEFHTLHSFSFSGNRFFRQ